MIIKQKIDLAKKLKIYKNNSNATLNKRKSSVIMIKNNVNYENNPNKQHQFKHFNSIMQNNINSKMNNSISVGSNIQQNGGSIANFKVKNSILYQDIKRLDINLNEFNSISTNLL